MPCGVAYDGHPLTVKPRERARYVIFRIVSRRAACKSVRSAVGAVDVTRLCAGAVRGAMERARRWWVAVLAATILTAMLPTFAAHRAPPSSLPAATEQNARIPDALLPRVNASFAADDPAYAVMALPDDSASLRAANPAHHLTTTFAPDGIAFAGAGDALWTLHLSGIGADAPSTVAPLRAGGRVEYRRGRRDGVVPQWPARRGAGFHPRRAPGITRCAHADPRCWRGHPLASTRAQ